MSARTKVAHNFHGSVFETLSKRCDSNNPTSTFETHASELRATLLSNLSSRGLRGLTAVHVGGGAWPHRCGGRRRIMAGSFPAPPDWRPPRGLRGLAGLRDDAPSEARGADGSRAGRRPRAHHAARPQHNARAAAGDQAATRSDRRIQTKSGGPQENLGTTTHAFTDVN